MIGWLTALALGMPTPEEEAFRFEPPGALAPSSGEGRADKMIYAPGLRFPLERAPAYLNSQVYGRGGFKGPGGRECDAENYQYPWRDNFCEERRFQMPLCPSGTGHQGQDVRPSTCEADRHWAVAARSGTVVRVGSYSVTLIDDDGSQHRYLHLDPASLLVGQGARVTAGDRIGRVSNTFFDGSGALVPTTVHLHYDLQMNLEGRNLFVPPYTSLVAAYQALLRTPDQVCAPIPAEGRTVQETEGCVDWFGPARFWRREATEGALDGGQYWTNAHPGDDPSNFARFRLRVATAGRYLIEVHLVPPRTRATRVPYRVRHRGQEQLVTLDPSGLTAPGWMRLGEFDLAAGGDQWVTVLDNSGETGSDLHISVDSIRVRPAP